MTLTATGGTYFPVAVDRRRFRKLDGGGPVWRRYFPLSTFLELVAKGELYPLLLLADCLEKRFRFVVFALAIKQRRVLPNDPLEAGAVP